MSIQLTPLAHTLRRLLLGASLSLASLPYAMAEDAQPRAYHILDSFPLTPNGKTDFIKLRNTLSAQNK